MYIYILQIKWALKKKENLIFIFKSVAVRLRDDSLFPSGARLQPGMAQNMKIFLTSEQYITRDVYTA
jgi:hypothetical protein